MEIAGFLKTSLIEWPGKITSVVFVPGCNFSCPFCHNRDLVGNRGLTLIGEEQIFTDLEKRKKWVDAVVVTGGEPTLQTDLSRFLSRCKQMGFLTMVETNGSEPEVIASLLSLPRGPLRPASRQGGREASKAGRYLVDFVAMDLKGPLGEYHKFTNIRYPISNIKRSMEMILKSGVECELRTTVVPGLHDKEVLLKMATELKKITDDCKLTSDSCRWYLQNFRPKNCLDPEFEKKKPFTKEQLEDFLKAVRKIIPRAELRGA